MTNPPPTRWDGTRFLVRVHAQPNAKRDQAVGLHGQAYRVRIAAPPREGKANQSLIAFFARAFGVPRARVQIRAGAGGRLKTIEIDRPERMPPWLESSADSGR